MQMKIFTCFLLIQISLFATYYSQSGQDQFVYEKYFLKKKEGVFVDIGAYDGIRYSNTYFFEKHLGWKGICIEPIPNVFESLLKNRNCICIQGCVSPESKQEEFLHLKGRTEMLSGLLSAYPSIHIERIKYELEKYGGSYEIIQVMCYPLDDLLKMHQLHHVDLLSLDTEGGELEILKSIDFRQTQIDVIIVENNYKDPLFEPFLFSKGYRCVKKFSHDLIFVHQNLYKEGDEMVASSNN